MSSLRVPIAIPVEISADGRRAFRLARSIGEDGVRLQRPAPFEPRRPVQIRFVLPEQTATIAVRADVANTDEDDDAAERSEGRELFFIEPPEADRAAVRKYVASRLGLPG
jgi:hypothetical protein